MRHFASLLGLFALAAAQLPDLDPPTNPFVPWGIHLAFGSDAATTMRVKWNTRQQVSGPSVVVGTSANNLYKAFPANTTSFTDGDLTLFVYYAEMAPLSPATTYYYQIVSSNGNNSAVYSFSTYDASKPTRVAVVGDMGTTPNGIMTTQFMASSVEAGKIDAIFHNGDLGYDLPDVVAPGIVTGDRFEMMIQNVSAYIPYAVAVGNHENEDDFLQYRGRFDQLSVSPPGSDGIFYSVDIGLVHYIVYSSESYFYFEPHGIGLLYNQYSWVLEDLQSVDRTKTPWIVLMSHRALTISSNDDADWAHYDPSIPRNGYGGYFAVEPLLYGFGVDIFIGAHEHSYERNYPIYNCTWNPSRTGPEAYVNYTLPINLLAGAGGCRENVDPWMPVGNPFSAVRSTDYGFGLLTAYNYTHALWQYYNSSSGDVIDEMWFVQYNHGPYPPLSTQNLSGHVCNTTVPEGVKSDDPDFPHVGPQRGDDHHKRPKDDLQNFVGALKHRNAKGGRKLEESPARHEDHVPKYVSVQEALDRVLNGGGSKL